MTFLKKLARFLPDALIIVGVTFGSLFFVDVAYTEQTAFMLCVFLTLLGIDILVRRHHARHHGCAGCKSDCCEVPE